MTSTAPGQFRITRTQLLNWGGFTQLQIVEAGRRGTALLGPSGRGKSTWLDAMASVVMPNPQQFNQAARDDSRGGQERTVYTYARGFLEHEGDRVDAKTSTPRYLRPPGGEGFPSGCAITYQHDDGRSVTLFRLAWVGPDVVDQDGINTATVYGFAHEDFSFERLHGLTPARSGSGPITPASVEALLQPSRGDVVNRSQAVVHAKMRQVMGLGDTEASQRKALNLLRMIQSSKGVFTINELFKGFVLTPPKALERWESTLTHFTEACALGDELNLAERKISLLQELPAAAAGHRDAQGDANTKAQLGREPEEKDVPSRLRVWHWGRTLEWAETEEVDRRLQEAIAKDELRTKEGELQAAKEAHERALAAYTAAGGDNAGVPREQLRSAQADLERIREQRRSMAARLAVFDLALPTSDGDVALTKELMAQRLTDEASRETDLRGAYDSLTSQRTARATQLNQLTAEASEAAKAKDNVDPAAKVVRERIARGSGVPAQRLPYVGELLDIEPEFRRWEAAILAVLGNFPQDMLALERDYRTVRVWVAHNRIDGRVTLAPPEAITAPPPIPGTVPAMLEVVEGPFHDRLVAELVKRFSFECVEDERELDGPRRTGVTGRVTRDGMRTGSHGRVVKDDRERKYKWIGRDNQALRTRLDEEIAACRNAGRILTEQVSEAWGALLSHERSTQLLRHLKDELTWEALDDSQVHDRIVQLMSELDALETPEALELRGRLNGSIEVMQDAAVAKDLAGTEHKKAAALWSSVTTVKDLAQAIVDGHEPLTAEEMGAASSLPYQAPDIIDLDPGQSDADERAEKRVAKVFEPLAGVLREQVTAARSREESFASTLRTMVKAYRGINEATSREIDDALEAVPALEAIYERLVADDLPRARTRLLEKLTKDLNTGLRSLTAQIASDRRDIRAGLDPIREVLSRVRFREGSTLAIEAIPVSNLERDKFDSAVEEYTRANPLGVDVFNDEAAVEAAFRALRRELGSMVERGREGDAWRKKVFDAREHVEFRAVETRPGHDKPIFHRGAAGMSGGEGQELIAFLLGAALRYRLAGEHADEATLPTYAPILLDEGFVKADSDFTGRALEALQELGFQLVVGAPREKASAFEDYVDRVGYITSDPDTPEGVRAVGMTIREALELDEEGAA
jgi:uncharacterized protein YPO0396